MQRSISNIVIKFCDIDRRSLIQVVREFFRVERVNKSEDVTRLFCSAVETLIDFFFESWSFRVGSLVWS